jgi:hypothetical protein
MIRSTNFRVMTKAPSANNHFGTDQIAATR